MRVQGFGDDMLRSWAHDSRSALLNMQAASGCVCLQVEAAGMLTGQLNMLSTELGTAAATSDSRMLPCFAGTPAELVAHRQM
jgi:hypothetical protein